MRVETGSENYLQCNAVLITRGHFYFVQFGLRTKTTSVRNLKEEHPLKTAMVKKTFLLKSF